MYQRTVLIVEDEILIRMMLADTLLDEGYEVIEAANVLEAIAVLGQRSIDAVVTDVDMPGGLSGLDLARMISSTHVNVPVIIASGGHLLRQDELPGDAVFVPKPYRLDVIAAMIGKMTTGETRRRRASKLVEVTYTPLENDYRIALPIGRRARRRIR